MSSVTMFPRALRSVTTVARSAQKTSAFNNSLNGYNRTYVTIAERVHRVTMFKMPKPEDQQRFLEQARKMAVDNQRNGKPYILTLAAGPTEDDPRNQGYTLATKTEFASIDDMKYYENDCPAHGAVKAVLKEVELDGMMTIFYKAQAIGGTQQ